jgi:hypothetical protein
MGSLVGQTESNIRQALRIADAMAPCVLFLDEVEKALSGVASSGQTDSGVSARLFGTFLTWLNDHESDVFVICTCNDISKLPPEFARVLPQLRCARLDHLREQLALIESLGGEGLMLRQPGSQYEAGRSSTLLKVKTFHDAEARVIDHVAQPCREGFR